MVLPLIAAGIGVIGAVSQMKAQMDAARAQNKAVAGQIYAEQRSDEIRRATAAFQKTQVTEQARIEAAQRRAAFREQDNALKLAAINVEAERAVAEVRANAQAVVNTRELQNLANKQSADASNSNVNKAKQRADLTRQMAQQGSSPQLEQSQTNRTANVVTELANARLSGGTTSAAIATANTGEDEVNAAIQQSLNTESLQQRELDAFDQYSDADEFTQSLQRGLDLGNASTATADANRRLAAGVRANNKLAAVNSAGLNIQRRQGRLDRNISTENANMAKRLNLASLTANSNLASSQSYSAQAQAYAQRSPGVNYGSALAGLAQQALPLVGSAVPSAKVRTPQAPEYGGVQLGYELTAPVLNANYNYDGVNSGGTLSRMAISR